MKYPLGLMLVALLVAAVFAISPRVENAARQAPITGDFVAAQALAEKQGSRLFVAVDESPG